MKIIKEIIAQFYVDGRGISFFRKFLGILTLIYLFISILPNFGELFKNQAVSNQSIKLLAENYQLGSWSLHWLTNMWQIHYVIILLLALFAVGLIFEYYSRICSLVLWILFISLGHQMIVFPAKEIWLFQILYLYSIFLNKDDKGKFFSTNTLLIVHLIVYSVFSGIRETVVLNENITLVNYLVWGGIATLPIAYQFFASRIALNIFMAVIQGYLFYTTKDYLFYGIHFLLWISLMPKEFFNYFYIGMDKEKILFKKKGWIVISLISYLLIISHIGTLSKHTRFFDTYNHIKFKLGSTYRGEQLFDKVYGWTGFHKNYLNMGAIDYPIRKSFVLGEGRRFSPIEDSYKFLNKKHWRSFLEVYPDLFRFDKDQLVLHNFLNYLCKKKKSDVNLFIEDYNQQFKTSNKVFIYTKKCHQ